MAVSLADVKRGLRIDNDYSDATIQMYMDSALAAILVTAGDAPTVEGGASEEVVSKYKDILSTYVIEYVRGIFFAIDNERMITVLQAQLEALTRYV